MRHFTPNRSQEEILAELEALKTLDLQWKAGRNFAYTYFANEEILELGKKAYALYYSENALNPTAFQSLLKMENSILSWSAKLFHGDDQCCGSLTTGGTESILMVVKMAREWGKANLKTDKKLNIVLASSAHPAFHKAAHYFGLELKIIPVNQNFEADLETMTQAIDDATAMVIASAPSYPHGIIDAVKDIALEAHTRNILCHVDACIGGYMLPFLKKLGHPIPDFDFTCLGVTSISADLHKYGYTAKGASIILYRNKELRKYQYYAYVDWPGGIYVSPSMTGSRSGGVIAAAYATIQFLGDSGYMSLASECIRAKEKLVFALNSIPDLQLIGNPQATLIAIKSDTIDIHQLADELAARNWHVDRQQDPESLHFTFSPIHAEVIDQFIHDLIESIEAAKKYNVNKLKSDLQIGAVKTLKKLLPKSIFNKLQESTSSASDLNSKRKASLYGMMAILKESGDLEETVIDYLNDLYS